MVALLLKFRLQKIMIIIWKWPKNGYAALRLEIHLGLEKQSDTGNLERKKHSADFLRMYCK